MRKMAYNFMDKGMLSFRKCSKIVYIKRSALLLRNYSDTNLIAQGDLESRK